jgi:hypothetical protein
MSRLGGVPTLPSFLLRFLIIAAVVGFGAIRGAETITHALLPLFKGELARLDDRFRIDRIYVDHDGADQVVRVEVGLAHEFSVKGRTFRPDPRGLATASTLVGNLTLPCVLLVAVALAWPVRDRALLTLRFLFLVPSLLVLCMLGVPFILWAALWGLILQVADPNGFSPLLMWSDFLLGGGHFALAIVLGACVGSIGARRSRS